MSLPPTPIRCDEKPSDHKSAWFQFLKSIATFKGDLASITAPPFLLAPQSIVEYSAYWAEHPSLLVAPAKESNVEKRALLVLQWFISTLRRQHASKDDNGKRKKLKPLNPFLGELFLGKWVDEAGTTELVSEQVSHHPPATAYRISNEAHGVTLEGHIAPKAYFSTTVNIERKGHSVLHLDKYDEDYMITMPKVHVEGLVTFQISPELSGTTYITSSSGFTSRIDFSCKGWLKGKSNSFIATVYRDGEEKSPLYTLEGQWSSSYTIKDAKGKLLDTVNLSKLSHTPLYVAPVSEQHPLESRRAWQHVTRAIDANDAYTTGQEKSKIENAQRALRKQEKAEGVVWDRRYFTQIPSDPQVDKLAGKLKAAEKEADQMFWKFDENKYQKVLDDEMSGIKSPRHMRFDSGVGLVASLEM